MHAIVLQRYGPSRELLLEEIPQPEPGPGDVLIRVHAAGVNPIDWRIRSGQLRLVWPVRLPFVPGYDVSGEVVQVGPQVTQFGPGDPVYAMLDYSRGGGGYAEYAIAAERLLARKPETASHDEAAGVPLAGLTALQALVDQGRARAGDEVLVNGASGGVGHYAVQIGKALGMRVTGVCSQRNVDFVRSLGADEVLDYGRDDFTRMDRKFHLVVDAVAKSSYGACRRILAPRGRYVTTVPSPSSIFFGLITRFSARRCVSFFVRPRGDQLRELAALYDRGKLRTELEAAVPLADAPRAHDLSQSGRARGKVVLRVL